MVQPSSAGAGRGSAEVPDGTTVPGEIEVVEPAEVSVQQVLGQHVPDKQIHRWKDDGGAVMPDA